jgi:3-hydroxy-3-methylglutaryl CoA synthase
MPDDKSVDEEKAMAEIVTRLTERFPDASQTEVTAAVDAARASFDSSKVRDFVPVLIEKEAKKRLKGKR